MKELTSHTEAQNRHPSHSEVVCNLNTTQASVRDGEQGLASPFRASASLANHMVLNIISDDENLSTVLAKNIDSSHMKFLVRIEPVEMDESTRMQEQCLHSATMLYNYGVAYAYISNFETSFPFATILREGAEHMFLLACSILSNEALAGSRSIDGALISRNPAFSRATLLTVVALQNLLELVASPRREEEYFYFLDIMESLLPTLQILVAIEEQSVQVVASAA